MAGTGAGPGVPSEALAGEAVGLVEVEELWQSWFRDYKVDVLDPA